MTLVLSIRNLDRLDNGEPARLTLDRHGAIIGRSPHADWSLPDPKSYISSTHCEIEFRDGGYQLIDKSTNGTFVNGASARMPGPHTIKDGDVILIGHYQVEARMSGEGGPSVSAAALAAGEPPGGVSAWEQHMAPPGASVGVDPSSWDRPAPRSAISGEGPMSSNWAAPAAAPATGGWGAPAPAQPAASNWGAPAAPAAPSNWGAPAAAAPPAPAASGWSSEDPHAAGAWAAPAAPAQQASGWSSDTPSAPDHTPAVDVWGQLAAGNAVDWNRGGFGASSQPAAPDPFGLAKPGGIAPAAAPAADPFGMASSPAAQPPAAAPTPAMQTPAWGAPPAAAVTTAPTAPTPQAPQAPAAPPPAAAAAAPAGAEWAAFLAAAGLAPPDVKSPPAAALQSAGALLRRLVAGMVVMMEARARAKAQLGAAATALEFDGNNPIKFARSPEKALAQLLNPQERGFMPAERAVEDAFQDLQAHQMATLAAMQGALQTTLDRFSPDSIRKRAEMRGVLAKIIPSAREATLWKAYEREFEGVARGSDEAFMDVFAKEFRRAYEKAAAEMKRR